MEKYLYRYHTAIYGKSARFYLLDTINRKIGDIEAIHILDFLKMLWQGKISSAEKLWGNMPKP